MTRHQAVLGAIETMADQLAQLEKVRRWKGLSLEQRAIAYHAVMMRAPNCTVGQLAAELGLDVDRVFTAMNVRGGPLDLGGPKGAAREDLLVFPSQTLAYEVFE